MVKGGISISAVGYIQVQAYTSYARIPLQNVAIAVTDINGNGIAMRLTNRNGMLDDLISIEVPDVAASQTPNTGIIPFSVVNIDARLKEFEAIHIEKLQVFPNIITDQDLEMIPLAELPDNMNLTEIFDTPPQNL